MALKYFFHIYVRLKTQCKCKKMIFQHYFRKISTLRYDSITFVAMVTLGVVLTPFVYKKAGVVLTPFVQKSWGCSHTFCTKIEVPSYRPSRMFIGICYEGMQIISYELWKYNFEISKMQYLKTISFQSILSIFFFIEIIYTQHFC